MSDFFDLYENVSEEYAVRTSVNSVSLYYHLCVWKSKELQADTLPAATIWTT